MLIGGQQLQPQHLSSCPARGLPTCLRSVYPYSRQRRIASTQTALVRGAPLPKSGPQPWWPTSGPGSSLFSRPAREGKSVRCASKRSQTGLLDSLLAYQRYRKLAAHRISIATLPEVLTSESLLPARNRFSMPLIVRAACLLTPMIRSGDHHCLLHDQKTLRPESYPS